MRVVIDRGRSEQIGIHLLEKLVLRKRDPLRIEPVPHQHQGNETANDRHPNDPRAGRHLEITALFRVLLVVVISIVVSHDSSRAIIA